MHRAGPWSRPDPPDVPAPDEGRGPAVAAVRVVPGACVAGVAPEGLDRPALVGHRVVGGLPRVLVALRPLRRGHSAAGDPLGHIPIQAYVGVMARAATTSDTFNAIAEPRRRDVLALLRGGERPVGDLARELGMSQPQASKHLRVLREVGLVRVRGAGRQRLYGLDARGLRPVHEWVGGFQRFWNESFDRLDTYVQDLERTRQEG